MLNQEKLLVINKAMETFNDRHPTKGGWSYVPTAGYTDGMLTLPNDSPKVRRFGIWFPEYLFSPGAERYDGILQIKPDMAVEEKARIRCLDYIEHHYKEDYVEGDDYMAEIVEAAIERLNRVKKANIIFKGFNCSIATIKWPKDQEAERMTVWPRLMVRDDWSVMPSILGPYSNLSDDKSLDDVAIAIIKVGVVLWEYAVRCHKVYVRYK